MRATLIDDLPDEKLATAVADLVRPGGRWRKVDRGYTQAQQWIVRWPDGRSVFVKSGTDALTWGWLEAEIGVYAAVDAPWMPRLVASAGDGQGCGPVLVLEDLHEAQWPDPWEDTMVAAVVATLEEVHARIAPAGLPPLSDRRDVLHGWPLVARDPRPFLSTGLAGARWLERALPVLEAASARADLSGDALLHLDLRSDNICRHRGQVKLVDWTWACRGNPVFDTCAWLPSLHAEGGPRPERIAPGQPEFAAMLAGYFCSQAGLPPQQPGSQRRAVQRAQAAAALPWAARELGLPDPGDAPREGVPR
ncbi:hypothetical protein [Streptomyces sp. IBSBF 2435]|uniref:hypothetical protein n=1 Tax=Streptomyces sp. IBSBF 2435 TaxID=2903531 RepID=UPI002FDBD00E